MIEMKGKWNKLQKRNFGISLIVLIITIIIILILTGTVIISFIDNDIIEKSNKAVFEQTKSNITDVCNLIDVQNELKENLNKPQITVTLVKIAEDVGKTEDELTDLGYSLVDNILYLNKGLENEEIIYNFGEEVTTPESSLDNNGVSNAAAVMKPVLGDALTPVTINEDLSETTTTADNSNWYAYIDQGTGDNKTSNWANAVTRDNSGNINGVFVWIPRYAYKITYHNSSDKSQGGDIDVIFVDMNNKDENGDILPSGYIVHPAFKNGSSTGFTNGEWDKELAGIWVGKYEVSGSTSALKVRPNEVSLRSVKISDMFTALLKFDDTVKNGSNIDSHMMKNSEWGAVAYLTHSQYGRNGTEVTINDNSSYVLGSDRVNTSTTGNTTGVYDMSGAHQEFVAGYVNNGNENLQTYGGNLTNNVGISNKYKTVYTKGEEDSKENNYNANSDKVGDAIYETSKESSGVTAWLSDYSVFPNDSSIFFLRGGLYHSRSSAGIFYFYGNYGGAESYSSSRLVLAF